MILLWCCLAADPALPAPKLEALGRGVVALRTAEDRAFVSWRLLAEDADAIRFDLFRQTGDEAPAKLNAAPLAMTHFEDRGATFDRPTKYFVQAAGGVRSAPFAFPAGAPIRPYLAIPLRTPPGCTPGDAAPADLDGDGEYELIVKQEQTPRDNSKPGPTGATKLEAYKLDGTFLWRIDLGPNVREGAHYTPFLAYDFDGDGRAEVLCRTADGTIDGAGKVLGDPKANWRNDAGFVLTGPERLTAFDGRTGRALDTVDFVPPRGRLKDWGDDYGNRADRFLAGVAYLDGAAPSAVFCRGYYTRTVLAAWDFRGGKLVRRWVFDSHAGGAGNRKFAGQGDHSLAVADVDGDGRDDIVYGACCIGSDGQGKYSTGLGHGDALHVSDFDPARPGLEAFNVHERKPPAGVTFRDAKTGAVLWSKPSEDVPRGLIADLDPRFPGAECWALGAGLEGLWNVRGEQVSKRRPRSCNFAVWWDGDPLRELLDRTRITKWDPQSESERPLLEARGCSASNGTKATPCLAGDILGDWREEVVWRSADHRELRVYSTTVPTELRLTTLVHDRQYRLALAWQNAGYNQPPHPSFFLGHGMTRTR